MVISDKGVEFITRFEGFKNKPYLDSAHIYTIGYGTTIYPNGSKVKGGDPAITKETALEYLKYHIDTKVIYAIKMELPQHQIDAICSFIYNVGSGNWNTSTLKKRIESHSSPDLIRDAFLLFNKAAGKVLNGLVLRRIAEARLFNENKYT